MAAKKGSSKKTLTTRTSKKRPSRRRAPAQDAMEFSTGQKIGTALIQDGSGGTRAVQYVEIDGLAMFEGDICLGTVEQVERDTQVARQAMRGELSRGVVVTGANRRWTNCQVPFTIDTALTGQDRVTDAIEHWETNTHYRFIERTPANAAQFPDFVTFRPASNCSSSVGRRSGQQFINLSTSCSTGNTIHEIGHTIGLWHEQSRADRDAFVTINFASIDPTAISNFDQHITDGDDVGPYDYGSIMHYPRTAFSIDGSETITPTDTSAVIGQRTALSPGDIAAANSLCTPVAPGTPNKFFDDQGTPNKFFDDPGTPNKFIDDPMTPNKFVDDPGTPNKFVDDPGTPNKFVDDPGTPIKFIDDQNPGTANKFIDDQNPGTANKFIDDQNPGTAIKFLDDQNPGTANKFLDDQNPGTANKFLDDQNPGTANKFLDDQNPGTANKFLDDPGTAGTVNKFADDPGTAKAVDDAKSPAEDKGPLDVGPALPGRIQPPVVRPSGAGRLPFALATPHHAPPEMIAAAGGVGQMDAAQLGASIQQLQQYVEALAQRLSDPYAAHAGHHSIDELLAEYQRVVVELHQAYDLYNRLAGQG